MNAQQKYRSKDWGEISKKVEEVRLKHIFKVITDGSHYSPSTVREGYPYITVSDVNNNTIDIEGSKRISPEDFQKMAKEGCRPQQNDILLSKDGTIGEGAVVYENEFVVLSSLAILRPYTNYNSDYLLYCLTSEPFKQQLKSRMTGAALKRVTLETLKEATIPVGPLEWQNDVVDFLNNNINKIDNVISKKEELTELLKERKKSNREFQFLHGNNSSELEVALEIDILKQRPSAWDVRRAKTLFTQRDDRGYDDLPLLEVSLNHGVRLREDNKDRTAWVASDLKNMKRVAEGDLVFNKMRLWQGAIGRSDYEGLVSPDYTVLEAQPEANSTFYEYLLQTEAYMTEINRRSYGVVDDRNRIYWKQFGDIPLLHPPLQEQIDIVNGVQNGESHIDTLLTEVESGIRLLNEKRDVLITKAVTGQIDLSNWQSTM